MRWVGFVIDREKTWGLLTEISFYPSRFSHLVESSVGEYDRGVVHRCRQTGTDVVAACHRSLEETQPLLEFYSLLVPFLFLMLGLCTVRRCIATLPHTH